MENWNIKNGFIHRPSKRSDDEDLYHDYESSYEPHQTTQTRNKRSVPEIRRSKKFCDGGGIFCALYRAVSGEPISTQLIAERRDESVPIPPPRYEGPPTPCPAKVEYVTPVFAKNYQGSWRYVVQIPYEGYFTQTVEVTRCLQTKCHYLDGGCLSSPIKYPIRGLEPWPKTLGSYAHITLPKTPQKISKKLLKPFNPKALKIWLQIVMKFE